MRKTNIVIFSSGVSDKNGTLFALQDSLRQHGYNCHQWRELFSDAHDSGNIALLPMLIKKIPSFDYAVLICEGHDHTIMSRGDERVETYTMRDNVLFEIGLCVSSLGLSKVVLITDEKVRIPEDLKGNNNQIALKQIIYNPADSRYTIENTVEELHAYISGSRFDVSPVVVGAAVTNACGYMTNFVLRTLQTVDDGFMLADGMLRVFEKKNVFIHIILPIDYTTDISERSERFLSSFSVGRAVNARSRSIEFKYKIEKDAIHIYDCPTSLVTSYSIAEMILDIEADDDADPSSSDRFYAKELDQFEAVLKSLCSEKFVRQNVGYYYLDYDEAKKERLTEELSKLVETQVFVERTEY